MRGRIFFIGFVITWLLVILLNSVNAGVRLPRPPTGTAVGGAVTDGFAVDIKDCAFTSPYATAADNESSSGTNVSKPAGSLHSEGMIACPMNVPPGTYYVSMNVGLIGVTQAQERVFWLNTAPYKDGFQNETATIIQDLTAPPPPSFDWGRGEFSRISNLCFTQWRGYITLIRDSR